MTRPIGAVCGAAILTGLTLSASAASADCFDRTVLISRYHYPVPSDIRNNWRDIYLLDLSVAPTLTTRLTKGAFSVPHYDNVSPEWSPDGSRVVFLSSRGAHPVLSIYGMDPTDANTDSEGDNLILLGEADADLNGPDWSAANTLLFTRLVGDHNQLFAATIDTAATALSDVTQKTSADGYRGHPKLSPDASGAVYPMLEYVSGSGYINRLVYFDFNSNVETQLSPATVSDDYPSWDPVSGALFFTRRTLTGAQEFDIWKADLDTIGTPDLTNLVQITTTANAAEVGPAISADGKCLAYLSSDLTVTYGPNSDLFIRDLATGQISQITMTRDLASVSWKP